MIARFPRTGFASVLKSAKSGDVIVTLGADGCQWFDNANARESRFDAVKVTPVDTTGAGDTFTGYLLAGLDRGMPMEQAIRLATRAGALAPTSHTKTPSSLRCVAASARMRWTRSRPSSPAASPRAGSW